MKVDKFRDPIHGFIEVRQRELEIINTRAFQRLRNIKQLAMTYYIYPGAEHTRFGHSLGVMHLVTRAFRSAIEGYEEEFPEPKRAHYEQILRLIALTHDIGHAPFSHASESVFPSGVEHEDFTVEIVTKTEIAFGHFGVFHKKIYEQKNDKCDCCHSKIDIIHSFSPELYLRVPKSYFFMQA